MCTVTLFEHKVCKHTWGLITEPCQPLAGFSNCPTFCDGSAKKQPKYLRTRSRPCPECELRGNYDRNSVRMVESMGRGLTWGVGPDRDDWGCEVKFSSGCVAF